MEKRYRLTVDFKCRVNDDVMGISDIDVMEKTRQFLTEISKDDDALLEIFKLNLFNFYIQHLEDSEATSKQLQIRDFKDIFLPRAGKVSGETASYIRELYGHEPLDREVWEDWQQKRGLIENQFDTLKLKKISFAEIKDGEREKKD